MGNGLNIPGDVLTEDICRDIAGCNFDSALFGSLSQDGAITKETFIRAVSRRTDVFFAMDIDERNNQLKIQAVNQALQGMGLKTWYYEDHKYDDDRHPRKRMEEAIDNSQCVVIFITRTYSQKVGSDSPNICQQVFNYAADRKTSTRMVTVVLEEAMLNPKLWHGEISIVLGNKQIVDMTGDFHRTEYVHRQCEILYRCITQKIGKTVAQFSVELGQILSAGSGSKSVPISGPTKPLRELTIAEVGSLLTALNMSIYKEAAAAKLVDGECLDVCETYEELKEMGIEMTAKAKILFNRLKDYRSYGVPLEYMNGGDAVFDDTATAADAKGPAHQKAPAAKYEEKVVNKEEFKANAGKVAGGYAAPKEAPKKQGGGSSGTSMLPSPPGGGGP